MANEGGAVGETKRLAKNTGFLYLLSFSSQLVNLALIPYETRVLGSEAYGVITLAVAMSSIMTILLDFGFILSATEKVVGLAGDGHALSRLVGNVALAKTFLAFVVGVGVVGLLLFVAPFADYRALFSLYYLAYVTNAFLPDFLYRGLEDMKAITIRSVLVKVSFSLPIFVFLKGPSDLWVVPAFLFAGNASAVLFSYVDVARRYGVRPVVPSPKNAALLLKGSFAFFVSRFASTFYQSMNSVILGLMYPGQAVVGQYGASEKFLSYAKVVSSPVADSLYPYMVRTKHYSLCLLVLKVSVPVIIVVAVLAGMFAEPLCAFAFGTGYDESAVLLRCLLPAIMVIFPTYVLCFPMLVPMGLSRYANRSNVVGATVQVLLLCALLAVSELDARTLCVAVSVSEVSVFLYRLWAVWAHRDRLQPS